MSDKDDIEGEGDDGKGGYRIGYGKPPLETRFKKGEPQNFRRGRKRKLTEREITAKLAYEQINVTEDGKTRKREAHETIVRRVRNQALKGDYKSQALWLKKTREDLEYIEALDRRRDDEGREARKYLQDKIEAMAARYEAQEAAKKANRGES
jgi:hypothetical protein